MNTILPIEYTLLYNLIIEGQSIRYIAKELNLAKNTVSRYRKMIGIVPLCACGQPATHQGWCKVRFQKSSSRQDFIKNWHSKKSKTVQEEYIREKLFIKKYKPLVHKIVNQLYSSFGYNILLEKKDFYQWGMERLVEVIRKYDPNKKVKFETYAYMRIKGKIIDELIRLRIYESNKVRVKKECRKNVFNIYRENKKNIQNPIRFDIERSEVDDSSLWETITNNSPSTDITIENKELRINMIKLLGVLTQRERFVISCLFYKGCSQKELTIKMNITSSRVNQLKKSALGKLKNELCNNKSLFTKITG